MEALKGCDYQKQYCSAGCDNECHFDPDMQYQNSVTDRPMEHTMNETIGCRECHFDFSRLDEYKREC